MFEECCGILSNIDKLSENVRNTSKKQDEYAKSLGLYIGNSYLIEKVFCNKKQQTIELDESKYIHFDLIEELDKLPRHEIERILLIFTDNSKINTSEKVTLLLTQHFANLSILTWEEQMEIYKVVVDYFCMDKEELIIKTHPADIMDYENVFPCAKIIRESIPSELLLYLFSKIPKTILTISSTAINTIGDKFENRIVFDFSFEKNYRDIHKYFSIFKLLQANNYNEIYYFYGVNEIMIKNLLKYSELDYRKSSFLENSIEFPSNAIVFVDDITKFDLDALIAKNNKIIFMNTKNIGTILELKKLDLLENVNPVDIIMRNSDEQVVYTIWMYMKGEALDVKEVRKQLMYENSEIKAQLYTGKDLKIKELEGILRATEKRLEFYINEVERLNKEISELRGKR